MQDYFASLFSPNSVIFSALQYMDKIALKLRIFLGGCRMKLKARRLTAGGLPPEARRA